jgi:mannose-6-phosphate isomerase
MKPYPMLMEPILKGRVWGGRGLSRLGKMLPPDEPIGESWEIADLPESVEDGRSVIANGPLAGRTLRQAIAEHGAMIMGDGALTDEGGFPLLIKYLDARQDLSVQVHPTAEYARAHPGAHAKSEAWVVIEAEPGAVIYRGIKPHVTAEAFASHVRGPEAVEDLIAVPVKAGDCYYLPSGTCHALGAGIVVAEIQTPSDTTFRLYDWGRIGRELHIEQAMACIEFGAPPPATRAGRPMEVMGLRTTPLLSEEHFEIERVEAINDGRFEIVCDNLPMILMMVAGEGHLRGGGADMPLTAGMTVLLPAALTDARADLTAGCALLSVTLPSPARGLIA